MGRAMSLSSRSTLNDFSCCGSFCILLTRGIHRDFDGDVPATNFLALKRSDGLLLFGFVANFHETITLAFPGLAPTLADDAGRYNFNPSFSEQCLKASLINVKAEI